MQIQWVQYGDLKSYKYLLVVHLGSRNHKHCVLVCDKVSNHEVKQLRTYWSTLTRLSLGEVIAWVKKYCPQSYRLAYRELPEAKTKVVRQY